MKGLRLPIESSDGLTRQLESAMVLLREQLEPLHWLLDADFRSVALDGTPFREWREAYDDIIVAEWASASLARPGFFPAYAKFVLPDWTQLVGFTEAPKKPPPEGHSQVDLRAMVQDAEFYASCIDAAYWEIYSPNDDWLLRLRSEFPAAPDIFLQGERV